jgi:hypothetical protein
MKAIDRQRLKPLMQREQQRFVSERPKSKALFERAGKSLLGGVPMNWMIKWAGAFPPFVREAQGAHFYDVDGHRYIDFCLGDTGAMTGHSPFATVKAIEDQMKRGITLMLPTEDAIFVAEELQQRFGLPCWQFALSATDANRFAIRLARQITRRPKILVFNWCYHGTVDESFITLHLDGTSRARSGNIGPPVDPCVTTKVVEFNDGVVDATTDEGGEKVFGGRNEHTFFHQARGITDSRYIPAYCLQFKTIEVGAAKHDARVGGRRSQRHQDLLPGVQTHALRADGIFERALSEHLPESPGRVTALRVAPPRPGGRVGIGEH